MREVETESREIACILGRTAARAFKMQANEIIDAFDKAEVKCLLLASSEELKLEVRRRVAEWKMKLLCEKNEAFSVIEKLHSNIILLGYTNLEIEGSIELIFAQYCVRQNKTNEAKSILFNLCSKLAKAIQETNADVYHYYSELSERLLSKINESG